MNNKIVFFVLALFFALSFADDDPAKVLVVYNENFPDDNGNGIGDSEEAAMFFAAKRGIPATNILAVNTTDYRFYLYEAGRVDMLDNLVTPLLAKLDSLGEANIYYILLSYGIPQKYVSESGMENPSRAVDNALCVIHSLGTMDSTVWPVYWHTNTGYFENAPTIGTDVGHFTGTEVFFGNRMFLVTRFDGINVERCKEIVERSLYGEMYFYPDSGYYGGTVYVDYRYGPYADFSGYPYGYGTYASADKDMAMATQFLDAYGWDYREEPNNLEIGEDGAEFLDGSDATWAASAIGYGGWYNYNTYHDAWEWKVGAFANDLNSNSALYLRSGTNTFLANSFRLGLTCGVGCIAEPYLTGHARPETFLYYMINGFNFAEASYLSQPSVMWMGVHVGDPIYNPHKPKTPVMDDVAPPIPVVEMGWSADSLRLSLSIETWDREPDLVKTRIIHGLSGEIARDTIDYGAVYSMWEKFAVGGYESGDTVCFEIDVIDPVLNRTALPVYCWEVGETGVLGIDEIQFANRPHFIAIDVFPNPFNSAVTIALDAPDWAIHELPLRVEIFDLNGRMVGEISVGDGSPVPSANGRGDLAPASREYVWTPDETVGSGVYLVRAKNDNQEATKRIVYLK